MEGNTESSSFSKVPREELLSRLKTYNLYHSEKGSTVQLRSTQVNSQDGDNLAVEGMLKIYWDVKRPIRLKKDDESFPQKSPPPRVQPGLDNLEKRVNAPGLSRSGPLRSRSYKAAQKSWDPGDTPANAASLDSGFLFGSSSRPRLTSDSSEPARTQPHTKVLGRPKSDLWDIKQNCLRRRYSINGHIYNSRTAVFTPAHGSMTNVRLNSRMTTPQVVELLLSKFRVENDSEDFALYAVHATGEFRRLKDTDTPLIERVLLGPSEDVAKIFIMEKSAEEDIPLEVGQYMKFPIPVLESILTKFTEQEEKEIEDIRQRYEAEKKRLRRYMTVMSTAV
ncbi:PREDICTED: ras association domain-containing protein 2-like [Branchiostoma belcheri]|uniref:Ras association domain-containing protein 2-like n=1 Tax=Branchiostoma belcheri TaxID=7741 RepID=A0A6P5A067_BRABE|nr:PREDICTED: ras association domain-containing protein 2-like [Branchiostoma belcheri]